MKTSEARAAVIAEGMTWLGTDFHLGAAIKGVGVDCTSFVLECYHVAGIALSLGPMPVKKDWFMHAEDNRIIDRVREYCHEVEVAQSGDLVLFFIGKSWAHAAIVKEWPIVIQAKWYSGVQMADVTQGDLKRLPRKIFSPWAHPDAVNWEA